MASTQKSDKPRQICPRCTEAATKICGCCKNISYYSPKCQQADCPTRKNLCKSFHDFAGPRPSPDMRRVVVFHPEEKKPRFMWAPLSDKNRGWGSGRVSPAETFGYHSNKIVWTPRETRKNIWTGKDLGYVIQVWFDDSWCINFKDDNQAMLATTRGVDPAWWSGPIVATCESLAGGRIEWCDRASRSSHAMLDMDLLAYSHLAGFLIDYSNETPGHSFCKGPKIQCVEMAGGQGGESTEVHRLVHMPRTHPMFQGQSALSEVSKVCLPLS